MFTPITITGTFENADGTAASGTLCATPSASLVNTGVELAASPICGVLNNVGALVGQNGLAFVVNATNDTGTLPEGEYYTFTLKLDGQSVVEFNAPVLTTPNPITLQQLQVNAI